MLQSVWSTVPSSNATKGNSFRCILDVRGAAMFSIVAQRAHAGRPWAVLSKVTDSDLKKILVHSGLPIF